MNKELEGMVEVVCADCRRYNEGIGEACDESQERKEKCDCMYYAKLFYNAGYRKVKNERLER